ncbi:transcription factor SPT20 homolog [Sinocyclocheilus anshuiensis]|uniref:transcription factor SPT20 homolog n=1 Tax=Sinocyclocheilus anshuiensis TaxID=1608454 RepID=UPI0007BA797C|nr:PREDICTED: transcription factor SPT20 homolog [Sinocyclocheilus anshuiensis]
MQQVLEYALDRAEYIVESARQQPAKRRVSSSGRKSLYQKLYELYIEQCEKEPELKKLRRNVNLLEKLVSQESVSCLVVNLYPGNEGYSLMLRGKNGSDSETIRLRYEETELLEYLDAEELPPILVDLLEKSQVNIFHCGCVIAEVRDYRQSGNAKMPTYQSRHILLRPTMQTLICDVHAMTSDHHKWTQCVDMWKQSSCQLTVPSEIDVEKYAVAEKSVKLDDTQPTVWPAQDVRDDYIFECEVGGQPQRTKVTIFQSKGDPLVFGKIFCTKDSKSEEDVTDLHLIHPPFLIGSKTDADQFLTQYKEVYERDVKCQVKMLHNSGSTGSQGQLSPSRENEADGFSALVQSSVLGKGVKHFFYYYQYETDDKLQLESQLILATAEPLCLDPSISVSCTTNRLLYNKQKMSTRSMKRVQTSTPSLCLGNPYSTQASSGHLKCPTPPPTKNQSLSRKHSMELGLLSPAALSPMQRSGTPKPSTPTPTNTPCSTPHPADVQCATPSVMPTPQDPALPQQPTLLTPFAQQQMTLPVMTIPLPTSSTTSSQVMTNPAGLNFINVVGPVCSPQTLMSGSNPMLGCSPGTLASGIPLSGLLPSAGLMSGALPAMQPAAPAGGPFGLNNSPGLRPLNLLQTFSPQQQSSQSATSSPQQQGDAADLGLTAEQGLSAQQTAVINLTGVGGFMSPQAAVAILAAPNATAANGYGSGGGSTGGAATATFRQPAKK